MEHGLPLAALEEVGGLATTVQIGEPLGIFGVLEMLPRPLVHLQELVQEIGVAGQAVRKEGGENRLVVRPPELHVPLEFQMGLVEDVHEVVDAAEGPVRAEFQLGADDLGGLGNHPRVVVLLSVVHDKPHRLQAVPRIDKTTLAGVQVEGSVGIHILEQDLVFLVPEFRQDGVDGALAITVVFIRAKGVLHDDAQVGQHHEMTMGKTPGLGGHGLLPAPLRIVHAGNVFLHGAVGLDSVLLLARGLEERRGAHGGKAFGEDVRGRHRGLARTVQGKVVGAVLGLAMRCKEIIPLTGNVKPPLLTADGGVEGGEHVYDAPLHPHVFLSVVDRSVAVQKGEVAPEFLVDAMLLPKGYHLVEQLLLITVDKRLEIHYCNSKVGRKMGKDGKGTIHNPARFSRRVA